jgi:hypothetical protein
MAKLSSKIIVLFVLLLFSPARNVISSGQTAQTGPEAERIVLESHTGKIAEAQKLKGPDVLLQFTAGGHILGFRKCEMFIASGDHALRIEFVNARPVSPVEAFLDTKNSQPAPQPLGKVAYRDLWDGVTLVYEKHGPGIIKSVYYIEPVGPQVGNPLGQIRLRYNAPVKVDDSGNLVFSLARGEMRESRPVAWQEIKGKKVPVEVTYRLIGEQEVGFIARSYDPRHPLVIDPVLTWNTFLGSSATDYGSAVAVDTSGNVYVVGSSFATWGSPVRPFAGGQTDAFVAKLNSSGVLQWNTFLGSAMSNADWGKAIAVDTSGNIYVAGSSGYSWGSPINPWVGVYGFSDVFIAKLNGNGSLQWNTFLGSTDNEQALGIALDTSGNIYVVGDSYATWGSPINPYVGDRDAFVAKLNNNGILQWNTFLGSSVSDRGLAMAVDTSGNSYVTGYSLATWGSPVRAYGGHEDAYVAKLNNGGILQWNTFLGSSSSDEEGLAVAADTNGNVYVAGLGSATWGSPIRPPTSNWDVIVAKLNGNGVLQWNTFLGGTNADAGEGIAVDTSGNIYVAGHSSATWGSPVNPYVSGNDAFAAKLNNSGILQWNTFLGGSSDDLCYSISLDTSGNAYMAGQCLGTWGSPVRPYSGSYDMFVAKISGIQRDDFLGTWDGEGVYYRNSETGKWIKLSSPANLIAAGDLEGNGDDLIGVYPTAAGVWVRSSSTGKWTRFASTSAKHIASGDMNGDGRDDFLGTWNGVGVYYRSSVSGLWIKMAEPANLLATGDLDGDNTDDLLAIFPSPAGVWARYSKTGKWVKLSTPSARDMASGDMNGDGRDDLLATWDGLGVFYRNSISGAWVKMASSADQVTCGDLDGDGKDDLIGLWTTSGGVFVKYSKTGTWVKLSNPPKDMASGLLRGGIWGSSQVGFMPLDLPTGGYAEDPITLSRYRDLSTEGPGGWRFMAQEEKNLMPQGTSEALATPGPGDPGFQYVVESNLFPQEQEKVIKEKKEEDRKGRNRNRLK